MTSTYTAKAAREGRWWVITVPGIGVTQSRTLRDAPTAACGLISAMRNIDENTISVAVIPEVGESTAEIVARAKAGVAELETHQRQVARTSRLAAAALAEHGLTGADIAAVLGVSPQRVSQLMKDGPVRVLGKA